MKNKKRLYIEKLEDRNLLNGVKIIAHGNLFSIDTPNIPAWVTSMSNEIAKRIASSNNQDNNIIPQFKLEISGSRRVDPYISGWKYHGDFSSSINPPNYDLKDSTGDAIISIDWSAVAEPGEAGTSEISKLVSNYLLDDKWRLGKQLLSLPIHLIGFSRGGSLISKLAYELGQQGLIVDHSTYLDAFPYIDDYGFFDFPIKVPSNVIFADSYYRKWQILSRRVEGTKEIDLKNELNNGGYVNSENFKLVDIGPHSNTHLWYQGTIDTEGTISDGIISDFNPDEFNWYKQYPRTENGFNLSFLDIIDLPLNGIGKNFYFLSGKGKRKSINLGDKWDNIILIDKSLEKIIEGDNIQLITYFTDYNNDSTITFGFDNDTNPYNGYNEVKEVKTVNITQEYIETSINTMNYQGEFYIYARIENSENSRFSYSRIKKIFPDSRKTTVDLFSSLFSAPFDKLSPNQTIDIKYEIQNQGSSNSGPFNVSFYLSKDNLIKKSDYLLDNISFVNIKPDFSTGIIEKSLTLPNECNNFWYGDGYYYIGSIIDPENNILDEIETNNLNRGEGIDYQRVSLKDTCPPKPGIIVYPSELVTQEGNSAVFSVRLATEPLSGVTIKIVSSDDKEGMVNISELTFDSSNWMNPKPVTVSGINDFILDGDKSYFITLFPAESKDYNYNKLDAEDVFVINIDQNFILTNPILKEDVNNDGLITPLDALLIINYINNHDENKSPFPYLDVSGDNYISPIDALLVINFINRHSIIQQTNATQISSSLESTVIDELFGYYSGLESNFKKNKKLRCQKPVVRYL